MLFLALIQPNSMELIVENIYNFYGSLGSLPCSQFPPQEPTAPVETSPRPIPF